MRVQSASSADEYIQKPVELRSTLRNALDSPVHAMLATFALQPSSHAVTCNLPEVLGSAFAMYIQLRRSSMSMIPAPMLPAEKASSRDVVAVKSPVTVSCR